jgi:hypothetical protein
MLGLFQNPPGHGSERRTKSVRSTRHTASPQDDKLPVILGLSQDPVARGSGRRTKSVRSTRRTACSRIQSHAAHG